MMQAQNPRDSGIRCAATTASSGGDGQAGRAINAAFDPVLANRARGQRGG